MRKLLFAVLLLAIVAAIALAFTATSAPTATPTLATLPQPQQLSTPLAESFQLKVPSVSAKSWIVLDMQSEQVLAQHNVHERLAPASLTKLMSAALVFDALKQNRLQLSQVVVVSEKAWRTGGSRMFIEVNKPVSVGDLIQGMIVQSGNDATVQLAETVAGSVDVFVARMNTLAKQLNMKNTHFSNPTGLNASDHYTTTHDLALLAHHILKTYPEYLHYFSQKTFTFNNITQSNRNGLLSRNLGVDGLKTGHTSTAGYCLAATAMRDGRRVLSIVMNAPSIRERENASQQLLNWAYQNTTLHTPVSPDRVVLTTDVRHGIQTQVGLGLKAPLWLTLPSDQVNQLQITAQRFTQPFAPIDQQRPLGMVTFSLGDTVLKQAYLHANASIERSGFFGRLWDDVLHRFTP